MCVYPVSRRPARWLATGVVTFMYLSLFGLSLYRCDFSTYTSKDVFISVFACLIAVVFLAIGATVWLYATNRLAASLFACFCFCTLLLFGLPGSIAHYRYLAFDPLRIAPDVALFSLSVLLFIFPLNYVQAVSGRQRDDYRPTSFAIVLTGWMYGFVILAWGLLSLFTHLLPAFFRAIPVFRVLQTGNIWYTFAAAVGIFSLVLCSYVQSPSPREKQQSLFILSGSLFVALPFLVFYVLVPLMGLHISGILHLESVFVVLFALALGYALLRYQLLFADSALRGGAIWIITGALLILCISLLTLFYHYLVLYKVINYSDLFYFVFICGIALCAPLLWWVAKTLVGRLFSQGRLPPTHFVGEPVQDSDEGVDLRHLVRFILAAASDLFKTDQVATFIFDESSGRYCLSSDESSLSSIARPSVLLHQLQLYLRSVTIDADTTLTYIDPASPIIPHMLSAHRPLLFREAMQDNAQVASAPIDKYIITSSCTLHEDGLLVPIWSQGKLTGLLALGARSDGQLYAGPDFDQAQAFVLRFAPVLEIARWYRHNQQQALLLNSLYSVSTMPNFVFKSVHDIHHIYATVAASAISAGAEFWVYDEQTATLHLSALAGFAPRLVSEATLATHADDWSSYFYHGKQSHDADRAHVPPAISREPDFPFAWLPLRKSERRWGVLVITYSRPHYFSHEEMRIFEMFASQCVASLENMKMTVELRAAYERQKEIDYLKDQFIMTTSHELRTPLTTVFGYVELLSQYHETLDVETCLEFIDKAYRGCDELTLLVGNILAASRVEGDMSRLDLRPIQLFSAIEHVLDILKGNIQREQREIRVDVAPSIHVLADDVRLRQVVLNILTNALKYSPADTPIRLTTSTRGDDVMVHIRDWGPGVPPEEQHRLFERFVRLKRDMNSPIRGAGLGLFICKQLLDAMHGRIWVESTGAPDEGSTFSFVLQRASHPQAGSSGITALSVENVS